MSLTFQGPHGAFERRWIVYALLEDNIQHHLEGEPKTDAFPALHALGEALSRAKVTVSATQLRAELARLPALLQLPAEALAVSVRTRAVCALAFPMPATQNTELASVCGWSVPFPVEGAETLGDIFGSLVEELLQVTAGATAEDVLTVIDQ